mmetsp:Transcript_37187/g.27485  ORF Transcript_37187/g.27485 Transcript_37187/m.27485 type:complete len:197 (+) Transcript_37187:1479-2069(+)
MAKMVNFGLYTLIQIELASNLAFFRSEPLISYEQNKFNCREDQAATNITNLLTTEYFLKLVYAPIMALLRYFGIKGILGKKAWKSEYVLSDDIVWLLYFQAILWVNQILFPFITFGAPFLLYSLFQVNYLYLKKFKTKPKKSTNASDTGYFIMIFLNFTFFVIAGLIILFLAAKMNHANWYYDGKQYDTQCGPYAD